MTPKATRLRTGREGMNKLEARYADALNARGDVALWMYEAVKFRLADGAYYTPDFLVVLKDGTVEIHETKGFLREAARVRVKVAARLYPFPFRMVKWAAGAWQSTEVTG